VRRHSVSFRPGAERDLRELDDYIAEQAGHTVADGYIERIEGLCHSLETHPLRGRARNEIKPGIRTFAFERGATIVYRVLKSEVLIIRIFYGGRDFERLLGRETEEQAKGT
jgi:toxin ParE1/3/4